MFRLHNVFAIIIFVSAVDAFSPRIIGGNKVTIQQYPYQVSLQKSNKHLCGATIIGVNWVITASQCVDGQNANVLTVRAGTASAAAGGTVHKIEQIIKHKDYNKVTKNNDIALIKVGTPFAVSKPEYNAVNLPIVDENVPSGKEAFLTGYGLTSATSSPTYLLQAASIPIIENKTCKKAAPSLTDTMICAGFATGGRDACAGDEGGPLVLAGKLVGITSWNFSCGKSGIPTVFTKVSTFRTWIKQNSGI